MGVKVQAILSNTILEDFHNKNYLEVKKLFKGDRYNGFSKLPLFVIYDSPKDFKGKYVVRLWQINRSLGVTLPTEYCVIKDTLEEARNSLPKGLVMINRDSKDDPVIIETWE